MRSFRNKYIENIATYFNGGFCGSQLPDLRFEGLMLLTSFFQVRSQSVDLLWKIFRICAYETKHKVHTLPLGAFVFHATDDADQLSLLAVRIFTRRFKFSISVKYTAS